MSIGRVPPRVLSRLERHFVTRRRPLLASAGLLALASLLAPSLTSASAASGTSDHLLRPLAGPESGTFPGAEVALGDVDNRGPRLDPLSEAVAATRVLGDGLALSWNIFGTPSALTRPGGWLAEGISGSPLQVARSFLKSHSGLVAMTPAEIDALELVYDQPFSGGSAAHVVLLRQRAGSLPLAEGGLISVGVRDGAVASLSTSAVGRVDLNTSTPSVTPVQAVLAAAKDAGVSQLSAGDLKIGKTDDAGFTLFVAEGLAQPQRTRLRALATPRAGVRLVWETDILDVAGGRALATMTYVDASTGKVLLRRDAVDTAAAGTQNVSGMRTIASASLGRSTQAAPSGGQLSGSFSATACSERLPLTVPAGTQSITVAIAALNPANDITFNVRRGEEVLLSQDLLSSPEAGTAPVAPAAKDGDVFTVDVCPFDDTTTAPFDFVGTYVNSDQPVGTGVLPGLPNIGLPGEQVFGPPTFRAFGSNPTLPKPDVQSPDTRQLVCGGDPGQTSSKDLATCDVFTYTDGSPLAYDVEATTGLPTFSTIGNNAVTTNAQASTSLTPGPPAVPFSSPTRDYDPAFTDAWHTSGCDPLETIGRADINTSIVNLFAGHNLVHDFAYRLGLVEQTGALQVNNFGKGGAEGDPEVGNAQNAAATNPTFVATNEATVPASGIGLTGRNNANQITLQDGVPGITNQYLFEPIVGFFGPCADGDLDASIFLHEYTHAISNRLVGGPDGSLSGEQGRAMGESWSDLVAVEYLQALDLAGKTGEDPFSVGAYATGDTFEGIRDYNLRPSENPLNYSSYGFDTTGPEVHADGEIWNAAQMTVREALSKKYDGQFPSSDKALQKACALGHTADGKEASTFDGCPGNRRWVTYLFDAMILQANPTPTMVDQKNMMLVADMMRTKGTDQQAIADAYATRGLGKSSAAVDSEDTDPTPGFDSPTAARNANLTFELVDDQAGTPVGGSVFVGRYQARATPIATTLGGDNPDAVADIVAGEHEFVVQAPGYGLQRFTETFTPGAATQTFRLQRNVASSENGASADGEGGTRLENLIDDSESTNGGFNGVEDGTEIAGQAVTVDLAGDFSLVTEIAVSALHHPRDPELEDDFQSRLTGVRAFDLQASTDGGQTYSTVYKSPDDFFPADLPRAVAPDLQLRTVVLDEPVTADHLRLVVRSNACTGAPGFQGADKNAVAEALAGTDCSATDNALQVTVAELQAFGTPTAAPPAAETPAGQVPSAAPSSAAGGDGTAAPTTQVAGGRLPATGAPIGIAVLGLGLLGLAGVALRRRMG